MDAQGTTSSNNDGQTSNPAGAPPLDWHADHHPEDGDWLWKLATAPYKGAHYACYPMALPKRLIEAMCPLRVCIVCGQPSERIVDVARAGAQENTDGRNGRKFADIERVATTLGWSDCGCGSACHPTTWRIDVVEVEQVKVDGKWLDMDEVDDPTDLPTRTKRKRKKVIDDLGHCGDPSHWRTGIVCDPFAGSGTTLEAAQAVGRHAIGIDLDPRNADLARSRCGMFLTVSEGAA